MELQDILVFVDNLIYSKTGKHLSTLQVNIFKGAWLGHKYERIAENNYCSEDYAKVIGSELWNLLSKTLGEKVSKKTFKAALERYQKYSGSVFASSEARVNSSNEQVKINNRVREALPDRPQSLENIQDLEFLGKPLEIGSKFYIERPPIESRCYQAIKQDGCLIGIKASPKMGKTSLAIRILDRAAKQRYNTAYLNFQSVDEGICLDLERLLKWLCATVTLKLELPNRIDEYWDNIANSKTNCNIYFEEYLLTILQQPLVLVFDRIDLLFYKSKVASDFFGLLRDWYEDAKNLEVWKKLRMIIIYSQEAIPLNRDRSLFNVGLAIELPEFKPEQVRELAFQYGIESTDDRLEQIIDRRDGNPYHLNLALYDLVKNQPTFRTIEQTTEFTPTSTLVEGISEPENPLPSLTIVHSSGKRITIEELRKKQKKIYLGRQTGKTPTQPEIDLTNIPYSERVSRFHAYIFWDSGVYSYKIVDNDSTNTTSLNGEVLEPGQPYILNDGNLLEFGKEHKIQFTVEVKNYT